MTAGGDMGDQSDAQWLAAVGTGRPPGPFGHREHLRLAWLALEAAPSTSDAQDRVSDAIRAIAGGMGVPQRYNRTVTDAWVRIVAHCRAAGRARTFDELLRDHPWLLDKRLLMRHYTSRTLASDPARRGWVEPDVRPIPG
jgi:hypothetical protein